MASTDLPWAQVMVFLDWSRVGTQIWLIV
jgi:hypothetical protein